MLYEVITIRQDPAAEVLPVVRIDEEDVVSRTHDPAESEEEPDNLADVVVLELLGETDPRARGPLGVEAVDVRREVALWVGHVVALRNNFV